MKPVIGKPCICKFVCKFVNLKLAFFYGFSVSIKTKAFIFLPYRAYADY